MGHDQAVWQRKQRIVRGHRLGVGDVEGGRRDGAITQCRRQCDLVDDRTARGVDQDGRGLHGRQRLRPHEVPGLGREVDVEGHEVGLGQKRVHRHRLDAERAWSSSDGGKASWTSTRMSKPRARLAISRPMRPKPTMPKVA